ncbi:MAG: 50S ribosomal protein L19 [Candidatus Omnitrophica bacterium]|nr:50S ribosomal protein L19 [Candidatus Omnitrophota bacterium]
MDKIDLIEASQLRDDIPEFAVGDTVKTYVRIMEGDKTRLQAFEGIVIKRRGRGLRATYTVRRISYGEGVERTFPVHSPTIEKIKVVKKGKVKRARLYYLRKRIGKRATLVKEADR